MTCLEQLQTVAQGLLLVGLPEEARIVEAGAQHALIAVPNHAVADRRQCSTPRRKCGSELAIRVFHREIFLMIAHHRDQNFFRQFQKLAIEITQNGRGTLGEVHHCVQQVLVFAPAGAGNGSGCGIERLANLLLALRAAQDFGATQRFDVCRSCSRDRDGASARIRCPRD